MGAVLDFKHRKIDDVVNEIHRQFGLMRDADTKSHTTRVRAGTMLVDLRARIESGEDGEGVNWWKWYDEKFTRTGRSRKDAEKLMRWVASGDPEAAHEEEKIERKARRESVYEDGAARRSINIEPNQDNSRGGSPPWDDDQPSGDSAPPPNGLVKQAWCLIMKMDAEQRRELLVKLRSYCNED